ncbi:MAG: GNAT family acetyltransferase [Chloroflexota bacterium]
MASFTTRTYKPSDYEKILALWKAAGIILSRSDTPAGLKQKLERDSDLFFVLEDESSRLIGAVMGSYDGRRGWINHLAIDPTYQGKGLGKIMMTELEKRFKAIGCEKINLLIEPTNAAVQSFYEGIGYTADELIFMEKWLS